jgi:cation transport regulator ChaC
VTDLSRALIEARLPPRAVPAVQPASVPEDQLRNSMDEALTARPPGKGAWVFAYGALLWEREFRFDAERVGTVPGLARRYCLLDESNRGTPGRKGLTLGLVPGEACLGGAIHLPGDGLREALWAVWRHEMSSGYYSYCVSSCLRY